MSMPAVMSDNLGADEPFLSFIFFRLRTFKWDPERTPLSSFAAPVFAIVFYLVALTALKLFIKQRDRVGLKPFVLRGPLLVHNMFLSGISLLVLVALVNTLGPKLQRLGLHGLICSPETLEDGRLHLLYYLNYLLKYYEFIDTFFLALRGKPTPFLHVYHHAATLMLTWVSQTWGLAVQWLPITLNLGVHVIMYWYYALQAIGKRVWWKKYLTSLQITQFVLDLIGCYYAVFSYFFGDGCHGNLKGAIFGCGILTSYLLLFVKFYFETYKNKSK